MGIIIDFILILIILLSSFLGYKKGLVELGAKLFAGIIAIIITIIIFKPVGNLIINNTQIDEKIENVILEKTSNVIDETSNVSDNEYIQNATDSVTNQVKNEIIPEQARNIAQNVIYIVCVLAIFIIIKIALRFVTALADLVASLPILKQFNEVGGLIYGVLRGVIIVGVCIIISAIIINLNPNGAVSENLNKTYITKYVYNTMIKTRIQS